MAHIYNISEKFSKINSVYGFLSVEFIGNLYKTSLNIVMVQEAKLERLEEWIVMGGEKQKRVLNQGLYLIILKDSQENCLEYEEHENQRRVLSYFKAIFFGKLPWYKLIQ